MILLGCPMAFPCGLPPIEFCPAVLYIAVGVNGYDVLHSYECFFSYGWKEAAGKAGQRVYLVHREGLLQQTIQERQPHGLILDVS